MSFTAFSERVIARQEAIARGEVLYLPYREVLPSLGRYIGGLEKEDYVLLTAATNVGKSSIMRHLFVRHPIHLAITHPESIRVRILYNALEEGPDHIRSGLLSSVLWYRHGKAVTKRTIKGKTQEPMSEELKAMLRSSARELESIVEHRLVITSKSDPANWIRFVMSDMAGRGRFLDESGQVVPEPWANEDSWTRYEPADEQLYYILISDHIGLYDHRGTRLHETLRRFSTFCRRVLCNKCGAIVVNVQQQSAESEKSHFTFRGERVDAKHEPSLGGLGDMKLSKRDATIILGLYDPAYYNIGTHKINTSNGTQAINVTSFRGLYRALYVLKSREGERNLQIPMLFNPIAERVHEHGVIPADQARRTIMLVKQA